MNFVSCAQTFCAEYFIFFYPIAQGFWRYSIPFRNPLVPLSIPKMQFHHPNLLFCCKPILAHKNTPHSVVSKLLLFRVSTLWGAYQYELRGDYYIPCLKLPAQKEERHIGVWGQRHLRYIREHKKALYTSLLTSGKLQSYLADVEEQAQELFDRLMKQRAEGEGITEVLKAGNQMEWIRRMNALRSAVTETVNAEVIFV